MNRKNLWFIPAIALVSGVAFSSCDKDDSPTASSLNGAYAGKISVHIPGIAKDDSVYSPPGIVKDDFEEDFTIATAGGKTTLSLTLNVPVEIPDAGTQIMPLPLNLELKNVITLTNAPVAVPALPATGYQTITVTLNGYVFNAADFSSTIPVIGGTIALKGHDSYTYNIKSYQGLHIIESDETSATIILNGTVSGGVFPQTLRIYIRIHGIKK